MVSSKQLFAKIDRPTGSLPLKFVFFVVATCSLCFCATGVVTFAKKPSANETVQNWSNNISSLLSLVRHRFRLFADPLPVLFPFSLVFFLQVESTVHLINKEQMVYAQNA
jgi:hypothetical protein